MRLAVGVIMLLGGIALWFTGRRERAVVPPWTPRLAVALASLGVSVLAARQPGLSWSISSICFSLIAIILILTVLWEMSRR